ncbi:MAG TPA: hypothetical protein VII47_06225 [Actinomycetota bacterium]|jgi:hypothetical protein
MAVPIVPARQVRAAFVDLDDVSDLAHEVDHLVRTGDLDAARRRLPVERPYPLPQELSAVVGATG